MKLFLAFFFTLLPAIVYSSKCPLEIFNPLGDYNVNVEVLRLKEPENPIEYVTSDTITNPRPFPNFRLVNKTGATFIIQRPQQPGNAGTAGCLLVNDADSSYWTAHCADFYDATLTNIRFEKGCEPQIFYVHSREFARAGDEPGNTKPNVLVGYAKKTTQYANRR